MLKRLASFVSALLLSISSSLFLLVPKVAAATVTWDGGGSDNNFSTAENWSGDTVPQNGDVIAFVPQGEEPISETLVNDLDGVKFAGLIRSSQVTTTYASYVIDRLAFATNAVITTQNNSRVNINISDSVTTDGMLIFDGSAHPFGATKDGISVTLQGATVRNVKPTPTCSGGGQGGGYLVSWRNTGSLTIAANTIHVMTGAETQVTVGAGGILVLPYNKSTVSSDITFLGGASSQSTSQCEKVSLISYNGHTLTGKITLNGSINYNVSYGKQLKITGQIVGSGSALLPSSKSAGTFINNASSDNSKTPEGKQEVAVKTLPTITNKKPQDGLTVDAKTIVTLDGSRGYVYVSDGGTLKGTGTTKSLSVDGILNPGHSPGKITVLETLTLQGNGVFEAELLNTNTYDQVVVGEDFEGTPGSYAVRLGYSDDERPTLKTILYGEYSIKAGDVFTIIDNKSDTDVEGIFDGLPEGETFKVNNGVFKISYKGGDGNDVTLTVVSAPDAPDTGFALLTSSPVITLGAATLAAGSLMGLSRRTGRKYSVRRK